jgi:23S rRNA (cytosine1962-C5)-methyltransferase
MKMDQPINGINILTQNFTDDYELIDSGNGLKLERFGNNIVSRPDTNCVWNTQKSSDEWNAAVASFKNSGWNFSKQFKEPWTISYKTLKNGGFCNNEIKMQLRGTISKNLGIFPEQSANWLWMSKIIANQKKQPNILNLFAYTGGATLCAAAAGASVCHVDASKSVVAWASQNQILSGLEKAKIRWIVDDCSKFVSREIKRGTVYDGIILDPPAFGRDNTGKVFEFEKQIFSLLDMCKKILCPEPLFFIFNGYSMGYSATVLKNLLSDFFPDKQIEFGELHLKEKSGHRSMPCSLYARF